MASLPERPNRYRRALLKGGALLLFFGGLPVLIGTPPGARESYIKAGYLYNFTRFVDWPPSRFPDASSPIVIGVLGRSAVVAELSALSQGHKVNGRDISVRQVVTPTEQRAVHVLFVAEDAERLLHTDREPGVLTVGESERFAALGGMITFVTEGQRIRFIINSGAAGRADLKLSSQLLKLAAAVRR